MVAENKKSISDPETYVVPFPNSDFIFLIPEYLSPC